MRDLEWNWFPYITVYLTNCINDCESFFLFSRLPQISAETLAPVTIHNSKMVTSVTPAWYHLSNQTAGLSGFVEVLESEVQQKRECELWMWLSLLLITELCEHNHIKFTVWVNLLNVCTRILTSKWLNTELGECRLVLQEDLCQWEFCLYSQLLIGIIVCQTLRVTDIHPPFMNHEALLQNEFYNVFLKYSSEVYIQVQLSPGSRSDCILYVNVVISEGNRESSTLYTASHCTSMTIISSNILLGITHLCPLGKLVLTGPSQWWNALFPFNFLSHVPYRPWDQPLPVSIYHHKETVMDCIASQIPFLQYLRHCTWLLLLFFW